jgi:hypothetical protein
MKSGYTFCAALIVSMLLIGLVGCEKGPAEKAGAGIDNAAEKAGDKIEKAGDAIKDTVSGENK